MHQIWLKGVPLEIGDLQLFTKKRQVFIKKNYKKKRKGKHYSIIFDPLDIPISMTKGNRKFMFSTFYMNRRQLDAIKNLIQNENQENQHSQLQKPKISRSKP
jgi:hypothetical protein